MIVLKRIIGWEAPPDNPEFAEKEAPAPDIKAARPDACPSCLEPAHQDGTLTLVGHGWYERWANIPQGIKIRIRRFLCKRCGKTCSVLPHWLLPRYTYTAPVILSSLHGYYVADKTAAAVTAGFALSQPKHGWRTLRRWGCAFLLSATLWGWLGTRLGARKHTVRSRRQVRILLERFFLSFTERIELRTAPDIAQVVRQSLGHMVFDDRNARSSLHRRSGAPSAFFPRRAQLAPPTQGAGAARSPP